jgi:hypothetical protein
MADEKTRDFWDKADTVSSIASKLLIPVILVIVADLLSASLRERQAAVDEGDLKRAWVELALSVLRDEKMEDQRDMRTWSVAVINHYVPEEIQLPTNLREGLVKGTVSLPGSTPYSIGGPQIPLIQAALNRQGLCGRELFADGLAGISTRLCLSEFLGGAPDAEVQALLNGAPDIVLQWVEAGTPPADWRVQAGTILTATPTVELLTESDKTFLEGLEAQRTERPVGLIQAALNRKGLCRDEVPADGFAGLGTRVCLGDFLGGVPDAQVRDLLNGAPDMLLSWVEAGAAPADWRDQAVAALNAPTIASPDLPPTDDPVALIQAALNRTGLCAVKADGMAGPSTHACLRSLLGDATNREIWALLTGAPDVLLQWAEAGAAPDDWRAQATAAAPPSAAEGR